MNQLDEDESAQIIGFHTLNHQRKYRLELSYIGTGFHGWQSQPDGTGIQDVVEKTLRVLLREHVRVVGASRTDTGVHAEHQVSGFATAKEINAERVIRGLNALLPPQIRATSLSPAGLNFHPIFDSTGKIYRYRIWCGFNAMPFIEPYCWIHVPKLDIDAMRLGAKVFLGTHDFTAFCAADSSAKTKTRTVYGVEVEQCGALLTVWCHGGGFLKQMVRSMVGALVAIGLGKSTPEQLAEVLRIANRQQAFKTAPANGLTLVRVLYGEQIDLKNFIEKCRSGYTIGIE